MYSKNDMLNSCNKLYYDSNILDSSDYEKCITEFGSHTKINKEQQIFGEIRTDKKQKYYDLFNVVKQYITDNYNNKVLINKLNIIIENIIDELETILISRYNNKEHNQYNSLLKSYNDIDTNINNELKNKDIITTFKELIATNNLKFIESSYTIRLIIFICLFIIFVILLIIYIKF